MHIAIFIPFLCMGKGGAERASILLATEMQNRGHKCTLLCTGNRLGMPAYPLSDNIEWYDLQLEDIASLHSAQQLLLNLQIDVLCCFNSGHAGLWIPALCSSNNIPLLWSERTAPCAAENFFWSRRERLACLAAADGIVLLCSSYTDSLPEFLRKKVFIIANSPPKPCVIDWNKKKLSRKCILAVSRLQQTDKQLATLIKAFSLLQHDFPDWDCIICGDGPFKKDYQSLINALESTSRIRLVGSVDNIDDYYAAAHVFCIPSAFEGFPNALIEAQSFGLPAVGFADCPGVNEIIIHGENGFLVPQREDEALADTLRILLQDETLRCRMGMRSQKMLNRYSRTNIFDDWENMFFRLAGRHNATTLTNIEKIPDDTIKQDIQKILHNPVVHLGIKKGKHIFSEIREKHKLAVEVANIIDNNLSINKNATM